MAIREGFDAMKFWQQARQVALRYRKTAEQAEDFASFCLEKFLHYKHFQPMTWMLADFFGGVRRAGGQEGYHAKHCIHYEDLLRGKNIESEAPSDQFDFLSEEQDFDSRIQFEQIKSYLSKNKQVNIWNRKKSNISLASLRDMAEKLNTPRIVVNVRGYK